MNIEKITSLAGQLQELGFGDLTPVLLKRICLKPKTFSCSQAVNTGNDKVVFSLFFERQDSTGNYRLYYFDAALQQLVSFSDTSVNGVNPAALNKQMSGIDWKEAFDFTAKEGWDATDTSVWSKGQTIEAVMDQVELLEATAEGKIIADSLKLKYWSGSAYPELFDRLTLPKNKSDICQRFYCFERQPAISAGEACRFLLNRQMERQLQARKRQSDKEKLPAEEDKNHVRNSLPKRKDAGKTAKSKKK